MADLLGDRATVGWIERKGGFGDRAYVGTCSFYVGGDCACWVTLALVRGLGLGSGNEFKKSKGVY